VPAHPDSAPTRRLGNGGPGLATRTEAPAQMSATTPSKKYSGVPPGSVHSSQENKLMRRRYRPDEWYREFGHRLRVTRIALDLTEEEAAAAAGRTVETWRRYEETGMGNITGPILLVTKRYNISLDWLFCAAGGGGRAHKSMPGRIAILPASRKAVQS
jgi:hypothetical protein